MIPREVIEEIRYRCDIEDVIGSYITLKRAGSNKNGLCPFHGEKTPSFTVFPNTKSFYCFGCGAGGDVVKDHGHICRIGDRLVHTDQTLLRCLIIVRRDDQRCVCADFIGKLGQIDGIVGVV